MVSITFSLSLVLAVVGVYAGLLPPVQGGGPLADPHGAPPEAGLHLAPQLGDARLAAETAQERGLLPLQQGPALTQYNEGFVNGFRHCFTDSKTGSNPLPFQPLDRL